MKIAVIGAGSVGGTLGAGWAKAGHTVTFAARDPKSKSVREALHLSQGRCAAAPVPDAVADAEVVALATPWGATKAALAGAGSLAGKTLLDCTNPLAANLELEYAHTVSGGEKVAEWAPGAKVVKIFNTTGYANMSNPDYNGQAATMFYAGDDAGAKALAAKLAADLGFEPIDAGPLTEARLLEPLALLWIRLALLRGQGRSIAFKLLKRPE